MAEKEERIYIRGYGKDNPCDTCEDTSGDECDFCVKDYEWNQSIPRQEAIEKISKRLEQFTEIPHVLAEIALNALLEGKCLNAVTVNIIR